VAAAETVAPASTGKSPAAATLETANAVKLTRQYRN
jgi:hypothetical protein